MASMSNVFSFVVYPFVQEWLINNIQWLYYNITIRAGDPKPHPGTPTFAKHRRRIYVLVTVVYILYQFYEADWTINREGDLYRDLGLSYDADAKDISRNLRKLSIKYHPDKRPASASPAELEYITLKYQQLSAATDLLVSPVTRFAYDRLGPAILDPSGSYARAKTSYDFTMAALRALPIFYVSFLIGNWFFAYIGILDSRSTFWRLLAIASLAVLELYTLTRPWHTWICFLPTLLNPWIRAAANTIPPWFARLAFGAGPGWETAYLRQPYLPFQALKVAHTSLAALFLAMSKLGPLLSPVDPAKEGSEEKQLAAQVARLEKAVAVTAAESGRQLLLEAAPFRRGQSGQDAGAKDPGLVRMASKVKDWFVVNALRQDPEVREAVAQVIERRAVGASGDA